MPAGERRHMEGDDDDAERLSGGKHQDSTGRKTA